MQGIRMKAIARCRLSIGIIEGIESGVLSVKLDGGSACVHVDTKFYKHRDYGCAAPF
jgi:hypothetical protein